MDGPEILVAPPIVTSEAFVVLPMVNPPSVEPKVQPNVEKVLLKLSATDSILSAPEPSKLLEAVVGALFWITTVPELIVVAPV